MRLVDLSEQFSLQRFVVDSHSGTHIDSPARLFTSGKKVDEFDVGRFMTDAVLLDVTARTGQAIDDEDLEAAEEAAGLALREHESVILYTATDVSSHDAYLSQNGAEYLEFKRVGLVGIDAVNIDSPESAEMVAHRVLLAKDILVLEGLRNLHSIDASRFTLLCFPLMVSAATSPVRAVAILQ